MKNGIKQDINFLDKPLWFQKVRGKEAKEYVWEDIDGYVYRAISPPDKVDIIILLFLLSCSQAKDYSAKIEISRYKILKSCGFSTSNQKCYERLAESLEKWTSVNIKFAGTFYNRGKYDTLNFHILDTAAINAETKQVEIRFNVEWLYAIKESAFFKYIDFEYYRELRTPTAMRLFELLGKSFVGRENWKIKAVLLGQKMGMTPRKTRKGTDVIYASDVLKAIKPAVNIINAKAKSRVFQKVVGSKNLYRYEYQIIGSRQKSIVCFTRHSINATQPTATSNTTKQSITTIQAPKTTAPALTHDNDCYNWLVSIKYVGKATAIRLLALPGAKNWQEIKAEYERQQDKIRRAPAWLTAAFSEKYKATAEKEVKKTRAELEIERYQKRYASLTDAEKASYKEQYNAFLDCLPSPIRAEQEKKANGFITWFGVQRG